jgi:hypothetical protein
MLSGEPGFVCSAVIGKVSVGSEGLSLQAEGKRGRRGFVRL